MSGAVPSMRSLPNSSGSGRAWKSTCAGASDRRSLTSGSGRNGCAITAAGSSAGGLGRELTVARPDPDDDREAGVALAQHRQRLPGRQAALDRGEDHDVGTRPAGEEQRVGGVVHGMQVQRLPADAAGQLPDEVLVVDDQDREPVRGGRPSLAAGPPLGGEVPCPVTGRRCRGPTHPKRPEM